MSRITGEPERIVAPKPTDPLVAKGFPKGASVSVPLDFLQGVAAIAQRNLERRPPPVRIPGRSRNRDAGEVASPEEIELVVVQDMADIAFGAATLLLRRKEEVLKSRDLGAVRGLAKVDRLCRMLVHFYDASANGLAGVNHK